MAKLALIDGARRASLYADLDAGLGANANVQIGHNTRLVRRYLPGVDAISIRLYATDVVTVYRDGHVEFATGGHATRTTLARINAVAHLLGFHAFIKGGAAYLDTLDSEKKGGLQHLDGACIW